MALKSKTKRMDHSYTPYTYNLKAILKNIFENFMYETKFRSLEFSTL